MSANNKKTGLNTYLAVLNMDKQECILSINKTRNKITNTNNEIRKTKNEINELDNKMRTQCTSGDNISMDSFDILRKHIGVLLSNEEELIEQERKLSSEYEIQMKEFFSKTKHIDLCNEKIQENQRAMRALQEKKLFQELDDLCIQRKWMLEEND